MVEEGRLYREGQGVREARDGCPRRALGSSMRFRTEADVRRALKAAADAVWWVENKRGGTPGFPDAVAVIGRRAAFLELKLAESDRFKAAPAQINVLRDLRRAGQPAWILAGIAGTGRLWAAGPDGVTRLGLSSGVGRRVVYRAERFDFEGEIPEFWQEMIRRLNL